MVSEVPMQTAPDHSPNQPVTVGQQGNAMVNNIRLTVPLSAWIVALFAVASVLISLWSLHEAAQIRMKEQLNAYNLDELKTNQVAYLIGKEQTDHDLIQAYGISKLIGAKHVNKSK